MSKAYLSLAEVAERFGVSKMTVRRWWATGAIPPPLKIGSTIRFSLNEIQQFESQAAASNRGENIPKPEGAIQ